MPTWLLRELLDTEDNCISINKSSSGPQAQGGLRPAGMSFITRGVMSYSLHSWGNPSSLRRCPQTLVSLYVPLQGGRAGRTASAGSCFAGNAPYSLFHKRKHFQREKKGIQNNKNNALQPRKKTDQTGAVRLYSGPAPSLPPRTKHCPRHWRW